MVGTGSVEVVGGCGWCGARRCSNGTGGVVVASWVA